MVSVNLDTKAVVEGPHSLEILVPTADQHWSYPILGPGGRNE